MSALPSPAPIERAIIFSTTMPALLAGTKTQTRRVVKWPGHARRPAGFAECEIRPTARRGFWECYWPNHGTQTVELRCPYGAPGDLLYTRETIWHRRFCVGAHEHRWGENRHRDVHYVIDTPERPWQDCTPDEEFVKRPAIFAPRWTSRAALEITAIRAERLLALTEEDAIAEGIERTAHGTFIADGEEFASARDAYLFAWDGLNGRRAPSDKNSHVWVIEFRRRTP